MNNFLVRILICLGAFSLSAYSYMNMQNKLTDLSIKIPELGKLVKQLHEENIRLKYHINTFENPENLMIIAQKPEFKHLRQPLSHEILVVRDEEVDSVKDVDQKEEAIREVAKAKPKIAFIFK
ncbi:MAG: hypothetical protein L0207_06575 [Chlamydiae bacterium]|nr:hypothetical protein [Chlamydiota bacterium]